MSAGAAAEVVRIGPQPGFQTKFLSSRADITIGGGAAGCGKTHAEIQAAARHMFVRGFAAVMFRRTTKQVRQPGGLWAKAREVYPLLGARGTEDDLEWNWPTGAMVKMAHLEHESNVHDWQGSEIPLIIFDELTHFTANQFWYLLSRNRSTCGVRPYVLATCNPDADSWVAALIEWWVDQDPESETYGLPIPGREGVLRYFTRVGDDMVWGDTREEVHAQAPDVPLDLVKSLTFIPGKLEENQVLEKADPSYRGNLMALPRVDRERLLGGNWKVRAVSGSYFARGEVTMIDAEPADLVAQTRGWDLAASEPTEGNPDPDWTFGVKMGRRKNGRFVILHAEYCRKREAGVRAIVKNTATADGTDVQIAIPQDPGQAGKGQAASYVDWLAGFVVNVEPETGDKETRAKTFAAQWQGGNVDMVRGPWNDPYLKQMEAFPSKKVHDDAVDATSTAFKKLMNQIATMADVPAVAWANLAKALGR